MNSPYLLGTSWVSGPVDVTYEMEALGLHRALRSMDKVCVGYCSLGFGISA